MITKRVRRHAILRRTLAGAVAALGMVVAVPVPASAATAPVRPWVAVVEDGASIHIERVDARTALEAARRVDERTGGADMAALALDTRVTAETDSAHRSTDPLRTSQWALDRLAFEDSRAAVDPSSVVVAVLDTGVDAGHEDLAGTLLPGWDFVNGTPDTGIDPYGHGTHVAGIVASLAANGKGVAGAAPGVRILPVRVLGDDGSGWTSDIADGIRWAADHGADVINLSLGGPSGASIYRAAIDYAVHVRGAVVVASAGNNYLDGNTVQYPAGDPEALAIASTTSSGTRSSFSSTGAHLDLAAPGSSIVAPCPAASQICSRGSGGYASLSGTSMAAPYAAAAAALVRAVRPTATPAEVRTWLSDTATDAGAAGVDAEFGAGIVDPWRAVAAADGAPDAPGGFTAAEVAPGTVELRWSAPAGHDLAGFSVSRNGTTIARLAVTQHTYRDGGLVPGSSHAYEVRAFDVAGSPGTAAGPVGLRLSVPALTPEVAAPAPPAGGYRVVGADGRVAVFGSAAHLGDATGREISAPIVASAGTPGGDGYWLAGADGAVYAYGDARFFGSLAGTALNQPIVGMAASRSGHGYWLLGADGGIFSFGDAGFFGSTGALRLNRPVVDMAPTPSGLGYWLVASDGGVFSFGDAGFSGSTGSMQLNRPVTSLTPSPAGGYWLVASDGGIFAFGVPFHGSLPGLGTPTPEGRRIRATGAGAGYYILGVDGSVFAFGTARPLGAATLTAVDLLLTP